MIHQAIECDKKKLANSQLLNKEKLENLASRIMLKYNARFTMKLVDCTEGSKASITKIKFDKYNRGSQKITVRIKLVNCREWWVVDITLKKDTPVNNLNLYKGIKEAAKVVCEVENKEIALLSKRQIASDSVPEQKLTDTGTGNDGATALQRASTLQPDRKKKMPRTAKVLTRDLIGAILERWPKDADGHMKKIWQLDFRPVLAAAGIKLNGQAVVVFLKKEGIIKRTTPMPRKPLLEVAPLGRSILKEYEQQLEEKRLADEEKAHLQEVLKFPRQSLTVLKKLQELQSAHLQLKEIDVAEKDMMQHITALQAELIRQEKELAGIRIKREEKLNKVKRLLSSISPDKVAALIETAEQTVP